MDVQKQLAFFKSLLDPFLENFLEEKIEETKKISPSSSVLTEQIKDLTLRGGDRMRPAFLYFTAKSQGVGDSVLTDILCPCASYELFHSFALIHDDIMDFGETRRGGATVHRFFAKKYQNDHLGLSLGILAGDLALVLSGEILGKANFSQEILRKAGFFFGRMKKEVMVGQYLDLVTQNKIDSGPETITAIMKYKTAKYTVVWPILLGLVLAGADKKAFAVFENYALPLGLAFQIKDDLLGVFGEEKITGKSADSDLKEGKMTLLVQKLLEKPDDKNLQKFLEIFGNKNIDKNDLIWVRNLLREKGALKYCEDQAEKLVLTAKKAIDDYPLPKESREFFWGIADFIIERKD